MDLDVFLRGAAHDLGSPLRKIRASVEWLQEGEGGPAELERILRGAERIEAIVIGLRRLSNVVSRQPVWEAIDLVAVALELASELRDASPDRDVRLALPEAAGVRGDPTLVRAALRELLENAWKFTAPRPVAHVALEPHGDGWVVRDDGVGCDPVLAQQLFAPFRRLHSQSEFPGSGLGLVVAREALARQGGWAEVVEAHPAAGAAFGFRLGAPPAA